MKSHLKTGYVGPSATWANKKKEETLNWSTFKSTLNDPRYGDKSPPQSNSSKKYPYYVSTASKNAKDEWEELRFCLSYLQKWNSCEGSQDSVPVATTALKQSQTRDWINGLRSLHDDRNDNKKSKRRKQSNQE